VRERFRDAQGTIARLAKESFAEHVITEVGPNEWRCARRSGGQYWFYLIARPGFLIIFGDIGDWILQHNDRDCVGWLRRAARDYEYLCGKLKAGRERRFYVGDAIASLEQEIAESDDPQHCSAAKVKEALGTDFDQHGWFEAWMELGVGCNDVSDCMDWDSGPLWMSEAVKWFAAHLPAQSATEAA
jgi:hypothetical protein